MPKITHRSTCRTTIRTETPGDAAAAVPKKIRRAQRRLHAAQVLQARDLARTLTAQRRKRHPNKVLRLVRELKALVRLARAEVSGLTNARATRHPHRAAKGTRP